VYVSDSDINSYRYHITYFSFSTLFYYCVVTINIFILYHHVSAISRNDAADNFVPCDRAFPLVFVAPVIGEIVKTASMLSAISVLDIDVMGESQSRI
jgi:hypothetical protein